MTDWKDKAGGMDEWVEKAKAVMEESMYATLATCSKDGIPHVSPVYTGHDSEYNFYFSSSELSKHMQNIQENNQVSLVIFNSMVPRGKGKGVFMQATVKELITEKEVEESYKYFYGRNDAEPHTLSYYLGATTRHIYKIIPTQIWMNAWEKVNGIYTDVRKEIPLIKK